MKYIQGQDRNQMALFPDLIDSRIDEDNPVRAIDVFVDGLNILGLGFQRAIPAKNGRPGYNPRDLLKLYLYGYMNGIRSSRKLETETNRNIELMWLLKGLTPDFKTIADFRKDNKKAIKNVFKEFTLLCKSWDLLSKELVAIDGSKFKAWNGKKKNFNTKKLKRKLNEINEKIDKYLKLLDDSDDDNNRPGDNIISSDKIKEKVKKLNDKKDQYEKYQKIIKESETTQISLTDPEARSMVNNQKIEVCYNVQSVVEEKNKLIIDYKATNRTKDHDLLSVMSKRAKEILEVESLEVLADKGYHKGVDIKECIDNNINPYVPKPDSKNKYYSVDDFEYNSDKDYFICPDGAILTLSNHFKRDGKNYKRYNNEKACQECTLKEKCTKAKSRYVSRWEHQDLLDKVEEQTKENWSKYRKRQWLVEHPFGTVKRQFGAYYLLTKGIDSVSAEMGLAFCAYNIKRVMNILGNKELIKRLKEWASLLFHILKINLLFSTKKLVIYS